MTTGSSASSTLEGGVLDEILEHIPSGAAVLIDGALHLNARAAEILGRDPSRIYRLDEWFTNVFGARAVEARERYEEDAEAGFPEPRTVVVTRPDGETRRVELRASRMGAAELWLLRDVTERYERERRLRVQAEMLDAVGQAVVMTDANGKVTYWNRAAEETYGWTSREALGRSLLELTVSPDAVPQARSVMHRLLNGEPWSGEFSVRTRDGRTFPAYVTDTPLRDEDGQVVAVISVTTDLSELHQALVALRRSETRFRKIFDHGWDVVVLADEDRHVAFVSDSIVRVLGLEASEFKRRFPKGDLIHSDDLPILSSLWERLLASRQRPYRTQIRALHADGSWRICKVRAANMLDDPAVGKIVLVLHDVTEQQEATIRLRNTMRSFEEAQRLAHIGSWEVDLVEGRTWSSVELYRIYGYDPATTESAEDMWLSCVLPEQRDAVREAMERSLETGRYEADFSIKRASDGELRTISARGAVDFDEDGTPLRHYGVAHDVTERLALEERARRAQRLESLVVLAGGVAHDFNNLLLAVLGNAALVLEDLEEDSPHRLGLLEIEQAAKRAAELSRQMLAFSGNGALQVGAVDVSGLIESVCSRVGPSLPGDVHLELELANALPLARGDETQLSQVVRNLIVNAAEAIGEASEGAVTIRTGLGRFEREQLRESYFDEGLEAGEYLWFEVTDTGCGMTPDMVARVCDPFYSTKFAGRGMGLAAVLGIVRSHDGALFVESEPGRGSTFRVLLPLVDVAAGSSPPALVETPQTILFVDDEAQVITLGQKILRRGGYRVITAESSHEAIEICLTRADELDAAVIDVTMPTLDGPEAVRELRARGIDLPVLLTSGFTADLVEDRIRDLVHTDFLEKPFTPKAMLAKLETLLAEGRRATS